MYVILMNVFFCVNLVNCAGIYTILMFVPLSNGYLYGEDLLTGKDRFHM